MTDQDPEDIKVSADSNHEAESQVKSAEQADQPETEDNQLGDLMAKPGAAKSAVDLDRQALQAAEDALARGERVLEEASDAIDGPSPAPQAAGSGRRELVLRVLLALNVVAMLVVAMLPSPQPTTQPTPTEIQEPAPVPRPAPATPTMSEPWNQALRASERRDFKSAVSILEAYIEDKPRMAPSERLSVLSALSFYASRDKDFAKSRLYSQKAMALEQSHSLPEDLVKEAAAAIESGDQEALRRLWARFLLQQRQIPSWLYQHVAQAYLELGDSYRKDANEAEQSARDQELKEAAARLRAEAERRGGK